MTLDGQHRTARRPGFGAEVRAGLRRSATGRGRPWLLAATLLSGALVAVLVAVAAPGSSVAAVAGPAQLVTSVLLPLSGVLLARDLARERGSDAGAARSVGAVIVAALAWAAGLAVVVFGVAVVVTAVAPTAGLGAPGRVLAVGLGGVALQATAQLVGTGLGLLLPRALVAFLATIVLPLGLWLLLGVLGPTAALQQWLTPFGATPPLLTGAPSGRDLAAWLVVLVLWGGLLNVAGAHRVRGNKRDPGQR